MSQRLFFTVVAVLYLILGIGHVVAPAAFQSGLGLTLTPSADLLARVIGSAAVGFALVNWGCRDAPPSRLFTMVLAGNLAEKVIQVGLILYAINVGIFNAMGWGVLALQALIGIGFAYFLFGRRAQVA
jgi:hypothetical protein